MLSDSYLQYAAGYQKKDVKSEDITKAIQDLEIMNDEHGAFWISVMTDENDEINHASDENEARWNYAFWLQKQITTVGENDDEEGRKIINKWISELGFNYTDEEEDLDFDSCLEMGGKITENFITVLIELVREILKDGIATKPILIHELEYYDQIRDQNIEANGAESLKDFSNWINVM